MTVTEDSIREAIEAIVATGAHPTQRAVRTRLGGGSYTTIGPVLAAWIEARREAEDDA